MHLGRGSMRDEVRKVDWEVGEMWRTLHALAKNPEFESIGNGEPLKAFSKIIEKLKFWGNV